MIKLHVDNIIKIPYSLNFSRETIFEVKPDFL